MEILKEILNRRSIRKFQDKQVEDDVIKKILHAAMQAPSANNEQPWEFIVVKNKDTLLKMTEIHPYAKMLKEAAIAIIVCGDLKRKKYQRVDGYKIVAQLLKTFCLKLY